MEETSTASKTSTSDIHFAPRQPPHKPSPDRITVEFEAYCAHSQPTRLSKDYAPHMMAYFRITLLRSAIGLPRKTSGVLEALGLKKRLNTVYHPVSPSVAGQVFAVKELVDVQEVDQALSKDELKELRRPDPGFYVEQRAKGSREGL